MKRVHPADVPAQAPRDAEPRHDNSERRALGKLGPRAAWLADVVASGAIDEDGLLKHDLWDPIEERVVYAAVDLLARELDIASGLRKQMRPGGAKRAHGLTSGGSR